MNDEQINQRIAEACGWKSHDHPDCMAKKVEWIMPEKWIMRPDGTLAFRHDIPNYCTDLNAMHEAEKTLSEANMFVMAHFIERFVSRHGQHYFHATARQRAEAFLRTLGKWEEATDKESLTVESTTEQSSAVHIGDTTEMVKEVQK